jgi:hypothetical protein
MDMSRGTVHAEVREDGVAVIPAEEVASIGAHPGDHLQLRLVTDRGAGASRATRESLRGSLKLSQRVPLSAFEVASRQATLDAERAEWPS